MKKYSLALMCACLLLLSGCQKTSPEDTPEPTPSQTVETSPVTPSPAEGDPSPLPSAEALEFPPFLVEFNFTYTKAWVTEGGSMHPINYWFTQEELDQLKEVLDPEAWWVADQLPTYGYTADYTLYDEDGHSLLVAECDEEKSLMVTEEDPFTLRYYYAPAAVMDALEPYLSRFSFLPGIDPFFDYDQLKIARGFTDQEEPGSDIYLLDSREQLSLLAALAPDTWTGIRDSSEIAVSWAPALELLDTEKNRMVLAPWDGEKCLVSCFFTDAYRRFADSDPGAVVRYWAPATVLERVQSLADGLTPLGTVSHVAERYFDLFLDDPGFDLLLGDRSTSGRITDDQMAAYILTVLGYERRIDFEIGVSKDTFDQVALKHFGRKMGSYETAWSKVLPSGNVTATGWDAHYGCYPILTEISDTDEYGNITATFRVYTLPEDLWLEDKLPVLQLRHVKEYLLTGHDESYLADEWSSVSTIEITFRIETEEADGAQREYVVYDALRTVTE